MERLVQQDQRIVAGAVAVIVFLAGVYTMAGVGMSMTAVDMTRMAGPVGDPMSMGNAPSWTPGYGALIFLMWWIMMIAMMTPSAAPMLLLYTALKRMGPDGHRAVRLSGLFLGGYLLAWAFFSLLATVAQAGLEAGGLADRAMITIASGRFAAIVLIAAGLYQLSGLKEACLSHCRSPAQFLADHNRPGLWGAVRTGAHHGAYCLGCCWALMALLFVGGIMNLYWIAGLALYVLAEKTVPNGRAFARLTGVALVGFGAALLLSAGI